MNSQQLEYETWVPASAVHEDQLKALVEQFSTVLGQPARVETRYVILTDNAEFSNVMEMMADGMVSKTKAPKVGKPKRGRKSNGAAKAVKVGAWSYLIEGTDEVISKQSINKRLAAFDLAKGTVLIGKKGRFVIERGDEGGPFVMKAVTQ